MTPRGDSVRTGKKLGRIGINTTQLIEHWTMDGDGDIDGRFRETDDILAVISGQYDSRLAAAPAPLQVRGAGEDDWTSLGGWGEGSGGRAS